MAECIFSLDQESKIYACVRKRDAMAKQLGLNPEDIVSYIVAMRIPDDKRDTMTQIIKDNGLVLKWLAEQ